MQLEGFTFDEYKTVDGDHGRIETRKYFMTSDRGWHTKIVFDLGVPDKDRSIPFPAYLSSVYKNPGHCFFGLIP